MQIPILHEDTHTLTVESGFVAVLNPGGLLIRLGDSVAIGHTEVGEAIENGTTD
ncbi:hypothetical protein VCRA2113O324_410018 [Vibrio crassostreae]|nr:hypothetical protein VCRA2113O324_410018 [Vibrio crassostreae]CAK2122143.1 hypothetical protein VCRA2111O320_400012 [Vibrio crassostreae]CAK2258627.1 hypothetical protein VCRA2119O381_920019 [Vibrio crassostreae]CAK2977356.1 hypothetical protein VCRA2121O336_400012 [Vibrio crassostreae]CAK3441260.1 hypothetical protein VCRA2120O329_380012 [Vibrio crassostreae]